MRMGRGPMNVTKLHIDGEARHENDCSSTQSHEVRSLRYARQRLVLGVKMKAHEEWADGRANRKHKVVHSTISWMRMGAGLISDAGMKKTMTRRRQVEWDTLGGYDMRDKVPREEEC